MLWLNRNDEMQRIATIFGLSFNSHFSFDWKNFFLSSFSTKVGRPVNEMTGTISGHSVIVRDSWYSVGRNGSIRTYIEIDGKGETYAATNGVFVTQEMPYGELWKRLRGLADPNTNIPESWQPPTKS